MRFIEIADSLLRASRGGINVYLWVRSDGSILFDTGEPDFDEALAKALSGFAPIQTLYLTHCHYDHAGSAARLAKLFGAPVVAHPDDAQLLREGRWRREGRPSPTLLGALLARLVASYYPDEIAPIPAIENLDPDAETLTHDIVLIALPGHCRGQVGYGVPLPGGRRAWIVGDVVMMVAGLREPILYEDRALGLSSIKTLARTVQHGDWICPGHGSPRMVTPRLIEELLRLSDR